MLGILNDTEIKEVLQNSMLGRIGCRNGNEIYIVPVTYIYVENAVICHSFEGKKMDMMRRNPEVCFEVENIVDHQNWKCIVAQGIFEEVTDSQLIDLVKRRLTEITLKRKASLTALPPAEYGPSSHRPDGASVFYKIELNTLTGRYEQPVKA